MSGTTLIQRYVEALGARDWDALTQLYDQDVVFYTPLKWGAKGVSFIIQFCEAAQQGFPGNTITLNDEFYSSDGTRAAFRFTTHWHNTGTFLGHEPTGEQGSSIETHTVRIRDGRITEQVVAVSTFHLPYIEMVNWEMEFPRDITDPAPAILSPPERPEAGSHE